MTAADPFRDHFRNRNIQQLVDALNKQVGNRGWVSARGFYLAALHEAFLASGLDCSGFINAGRMTITRIKLDGKRLVPIAEQKSASIEPVLPKPVHLVYGPSGTGNGLVFVERAKAEEQKGFNEARTWGELRGSAPQLYQRALDQRFDPDTDEEAIHADHEVFDPMTLNGFVDGDFLDFPEQLMLDFVPEAVQSRFGEIHESVFNGPMLVLDAGQESAIVAAMAREGITCEKNEGLVSEFYR